MEPPPTRLVYGSAEHPLACDVPPALAAYANALFPDLRRAPDFVGPSTLVVEEVERGWAVWEPGRVVEAESAAEALTVFELWLAERLARPTDGGEVLHAGGVATRDGAILFAGDGGAGKSTLVAGLARRGYPVFGDDVVLLDPSAGGVRAFPRLLKVHEPGRTLLGLPPAPSPLDRLWTGAAFYRPCDLGTSWASPAPVARVFDVRLLPGADVRLVALRPAEGVRRLLAQIVLRPWLEGAAFATVAAVMTQAEFGEMRHGNTPRALDALVDAGMLPPPPERS